MFLQTRSGKKIFSILAAIVITSAVQSAVLPMNVNAAAESKTGVVTASYLNVRSGPGTGYSIINGLANGKSVTVLSEDSGWYKVQLSGSRTGWVSADYIKMNTSADTGKDTSSSDKTTTGTKNDAKPAETKQSTVKDEGRGICTVTGYYTNLRKGAGTSYSVISQIYKGTAGAILDKQGSWYKIRLADGTIGWVSQKYIKTTGYKAAVTTQSAVARTGRIIVTGSSVKVRTSASSSATSVGTVNKNEVYTYTAVKNGWYLIKTPSGTNAYISGDYVKPFTQYAINGGGSYIWPTQTASRISSHYGEIEDVRNNRVHYGIDIAAPGGSQILAVAAGTVVAKSYEAGGYGYYITIQQNDGIRAIYAHMRAPSFLSVGAKVNAADSIGLVGCTGHATSNHLHLEFRKNGKRIDPLSYYPNFQ